MDAPVTVDPREDAYATPIERIDVSNPHLYQDDTWRPYFERLRHEDPVHWCENGIYGAFWSVTRYRDIMAVDTNHKAFSSDALMGGIVLRDLPVDFRRPSFISMDPPKHDEQRKIVAPIVAPGNLAKLSDTIRERAGRILDNLPRDETFDWVERVSIELTTQMLATLFDFPFEERNKLTYWSNVASVNTRAGTEIDSEAKRNAVLDQAVAYFTDLWHLRAKQPPRPDLISMLAHGEATRDLPSRPHEFMGNLMLLVVGGNDTTRNSISGGVLALNQYPDQYRKLRDDPSLVTGMVPEIIRWQSPVIHMRRTALADTEVAGKTIRKGDKVAMWYLSGNRDETAIENPDALVIDRPSSAPASVVWFRHPSLCRQPSGGNATDHPVGGNPQAEAAADRGRRGAHPRILQYPALDCFFACPYSSRLTERQHVDPAITTASPITRCGARIRWPRWTWQPDATTPTKPSTSELLGWPDRYGRNHGIAAGDRVAILAPNTTDTFDVQFACGRLGAIFVPLNWRLANPELLAILADCTPAMLIYDPEFAERAGTSLKPAVSATWFRLA